MKQNSFTGELVLTSHWERLLTQMYSCAQVKIDSSANGVPDAIYKIPGIYNESQVIWNGLSVYTDSVEQIKTDIENSPIGDAIWTGGSDTSGTLSI